MRFLNRLVVLFLLPCLVVDPALGHSLSTFRPVVSHSLPTPTPSFDRQALTLDLIEFVRAIVPSARWRRIRKTPRLTTTDEQIDLVGQTPRVGHVTNSILPSNVASMRSRLHEEIERMRSAAPEGKKDDFKRIESDIDRMLETIQGRIASGQIRLLRWPEGGERASAAPENDPVFIILPGTFDPAHFGHIRVLLAALLALSDPSVAAPRTYTLGMAPNGEKVQGPSGKTWKPTSNPLAQRMRTLEDRVAPFSPLIHVLTRRTDQLNLLGKELAMQALTERAAASPDENRKPTVYLVLGSDIFGQWIGFTRQKLLPGYSLDLHMAIAEDPSHPLTEIDRQHILPGDHIFEVPTIGPRSTEIRLNEGATGSSPEPTRDYHHPLPEHSPMLTHATHQEMDQFIAKLAALKPSPGFRIEPLDWKTISARRAQDFFAQVRKGASFSPLFRKLFEEELRAAPGRHPPSFRRIVRTAEAAPGDVLPAAGHASDWGGYVMVEEKDMAAPHYTQVLEPAIIVEEFLAFMGQSPAACAAWRIVCRTWLADEDRLLENLLVDPTLEKEFQAQLKEEEQDPVPLKKAFNDGLANLEAMNGARDPELLTKLSMQETLPKSVTDKLFNSLFDIAENSYDEKKSGQTVGIGLDYFVLDSPEGEKVITTERSGLRPPQEVTSLLEHTAIERLQIDRPLINLFHDDFYTVLEHLPGILVGIENRLNYDLQRTPNARIFIRWDHVGITAEPRALPIVLNQGTPNVDSRPYTIRIQWVSACMIRQGDVQIPREAFLQRHGPRDYTHPTKVIDPNSADRLTLGNGGRAADPATPRGTIGRRDILAAAAGLFLGTIPFWRWRRIRSDDVQIAKAQIQLFLDRDPPIQLEGRQSRLADPSPRMYEAHRIQAFGPLPDRVAKLLSAFRDNGRGSLESPPDQESAPGKIVEMLATSLEENGASNVLKRFVPTPGGPRKMRDLLRALEDQSDPETTRDPAWLIMALLRIRSPGDPWKNSAGRSLDIESLMRRAVFLFREGDTSASVPLSLVQALGRMLASYSPWSRPPGLIALLNYFQDRLELELAISLKATQRFTSLLRAGRWEGGATEMDLQNLRVFWLSAAQIVAVALDRRSLFYGRISPKLLEQTVQSLATGVRLYLSEPLAPLRESLANKLIHRVVSRGDALDQDFFEVYRALTLWERNQQEYRNHGKPLSRRKLDPDPATPPAPVRAQLALCVSA